MSAHISALEDNIAGVENEQKERERKLLIAEATSSVLSARTAESQEEKIAAAISGTGTALGAHGEVWSDIASEVASGVSVYLDVKANPSQAPAILLEHAFTSSYSVYNKIRTFTDLDDYVVEQNSVVAMRATLNSYLHNCRDRKGTLSELGIDETFEGESSEAEFLSRTAREYARDKGISSFLISSDIPVVGNDFLIFTQENLRGKFVQLLSELRFLTTQAEDSIEPDSGPYIASVTPSSLPGLTTSETQKIRITGGGFSRDVSLQFYNGSDCTPCGNQRSITWIDEKTLEYDVAVGSEAATWEVYVVDDEGKSPEPGTFEVTGRGDASPPESPRNLSAVSKSQSSASRFSISWQNSEDETGVVAALYKLGSPPE